MQTYSLLKHCFVFVFIISFRCSSYGFAPATVFLILTLISDTTVSLFPYSVGTGTKVELLKLGYQYH
jgi:hypothetical protein